MTLMTTFWEGRGKGETQNRRRKGETQTRRRSCGFEIRRQKRLDLFLCGFEIRRQKRLDLFLCGFEIRRQKRLDLFLCGFEIRLKRGCVSPAGPFSGLQIRNSYPYGGGLQIRRNREREKTRAQKPGHFCRLRLPACCPSPIPRVSAGEARHLPPSARFCPTWNPLPHWYPHISSALQAD